MKRQYPLHDDHSFVSHRWVKFLWKNIHKCVVSDVTNNLMYCAKQLSMQSHSFTIHFVNIGVETRAGEYKTQMEPYKVTNITSETRAVIGRFMELPVVKQLCAESTAFLQWMEDKHTPQSINKQDFFVYQKVLLLLTYFRCGMLLMIVNKNK